jgi:hypothetical protein
LFALKKLNNNKKIPTLITTMPLTVGGTWSATKDNENQIN